MSRKIFTLGEIVVEIMADKRGQSFTRSGIWHGPFASGAPAIFIDQVAKLGFPASIISCVGNDGFGEINIEKLKEDGVDISNINILDNQTTGSAFVTYQKNGDRDFIFNIKNSACAHIHPDMVDHHILKECSHLHIMGSSLFSDTILQTAKKAIEIVKQNHGTISFDPNIRKEILNAPGMRTALSYILYQTDIYLPSENEISLLLNENYTEKQAIEYYLNNGISCVVIKKGDKGASYYSITEQFDVPAHKVEEIDPTGAGDCFGGAYIALINNGFSPQKALLYANACGALAVTQQGPMQGTSTILEIEHFLNK